MRPHTAAPQASTLVVSDRPTAQAVVSHFERHRVGIATCKILAELQAPAPAAAAEPGGLQPLAAYVDARIDVEGAAALVQHLLRNWWLAPSRQAAMAAVQQDRQGGSGRQRRNIVTLQVCAAQERGPAAWLTLLDEGGQHPLGNVSGWKA